MVMVVIVVGIVGGVIGVKYVTFLCYKHVRTCRSHTLIFYWT